MIKAGRKDLEISPFYYNLAGANTKCELYEEASKNYLKVVKI